MTILALLLLAAYVALQFKTSRSDGVLVRTHPYRQMMFHLMPSKWEALVYYDLEVDAEKLLAYREASSGLNVTHLVVAAWALAIERVPKMNRFVSGRRLYQRRERAIAFSMKRKKLDESAAVAVVRVKVKPEDSLTSLVARINEEIGHERSGNETAMDKEISLFLRLPRAVLNVAIPLLRWLDYYGLLPKALIGGDPMYSSAFVANLGSLGMKAGFHHLFEWGNCPIFAMAGEIESRPVVVEGEVVIRRVLPLRFTYDERIDDGLSASKGLAELQAILEDPAAHFGEPGLDAGAAPELR